MSSLDEKSNDRKGSEHLIDLIYIEDHVVSESVSAPLSKEVKNELESLQSTLCLVRKHLFQEEPPTVVKSRVLLTAAKLLKNSFWRRFFYAVFILPTRHPALGLAASAALILLVVTVYNQSHETEKGINGLDFHRSESPREKRKRKDKEGKIVEPLTRDVIFPKSFNQPSGNMGDFSAVDRVELTEKKGLLEEKKNTNQEKDENLSFNRTQAGYYGVVGEPGESSGVGNRLAKDKPTTETVSLTTQSKSSVDVSRLQRGFGKVTLSSRAPSQRQHARSSAIVLYRQGVAFLARRKPGKAAMAFSRAYRGPKGMDRNLILVRWAESEIGMGRYKKAADLLSKVKTPSSRVVSIVLQLRRNIRSKEMRSGRKQQEAKNKTSQKNSALGL